MKRTAAVTVTVSANNITTNALQQDSSIAFAATLLVLHILKLYDT